MDWNAVTAVATAVSMVAFIVTALYIRAELKAVEKDRYLAVTNQLFAIWQTREFMDAQLWLLHSLKETAWPAFVAAHRGDVGEAALHRVGAFYDRIGTLARLRLIDEREILATLGGYAIAVWGKIEPLVREARRLENSTLFADFERLLPACRECYVPGLQGPAGAEPAGRLDVPTLRERLGRGEALTLLDVRPPEQVRAEPGTLPGALRIPAAEVESRLGELPRDREVVTFCA